MPRSKHRRKPGEKSVRHPGRDRPGRPSPSIDAYLAPYRQMRDAVVAPFRRQTRDDAPVSYLLDLTLDELWERPSVSRAAITARFLRPLEDEDGSMIRHTPEEADAGWMELVEREFVVLDDDVVTVHPRIAQHFAAAPAMQAQPPHTPAA